MNTMTLLNEHGDITITWDSTNEKEIEAMVEEKMKLGYKFFIIEKALGFIPMKKELKDSELIPFVENKKLVIKDKHVSKLAEKGLVNVAKGSHGSKGKISGVASTAKEVITNNTMVSKPRVAG